METENADLNLISMCWVSGLPMKACCSLPAFQYRYIEDGHSWSEQLVRMKHGMSFGKTEERSCRYDPWFILGFPHLQFTRVNFGKMSIGNRCLSRWNMFLG
jgi:hypothetical protein